MTGKMAKDISIFEFACEAPLRFFEYCSACPRFTKDCPDLALGKEILRGKKKLVHGDTKAEDTIHASEFNCLAPLYYFEQSRRNCAHAGRCREEGLLLALLGGKKGLDHSRKDVADLAPLRRKTRLARSAGSKPRRAAAAS
jgi:hypothetical protein